jgi:hypothetical protein
MITAIDLLHHTHTDFGYTDLPSTCWSLHARYIEQAVTFCERFADYPDAARFRWTCETLRPVQKFLAEAPVECRQRFDRCFERGLIDVAAAPFHTSSLMDPAEWEALRDDLAPLYARYAPVGMFQNDVTGFPWGLAEL